MVVVLVATAASAVEAVVTGATVNVVVVESEASDTICGDGWICSTGVY